MYLQHILRHTAKHSKYVGNKALSTTRYCQMWFKRTAKIRHMSQVWWSEYIKINSSHSRFLILFFLLLGWDKSAVFSELEILSIADDSTEIVLQYFLILKEIRTLDAIPINGKTYDATLDFWEPEAEATAAPARLPSEVFCKIIGKQPRMVGSRKSTKNLTLVAARA